MTLTRSVTILAVFTLGVGFTTLAHAQAAGPTGGKLKANPHRQSRQPIIEALAKVDLSTDEKAKVRELVKTRNESILKFRNEHQGDQAAIGAFVKDQQKLFMDGIKSTLTPEHYDRFTTELQKILEAMRKPSKATP